MTTEAVQVLLRGTNNSFTQNAKLSCELWACIQGCFLEAGHNSCDKTDTSVLCKAAI